ncbi:HNH endonuclease domain-containing protein [Flectobacillus sp. DC10W]|uniref:HNH endonuclease domain-containing protein n=1 Tax=Flectobacillus longus TaxID=2984207 RepID=A0ABT6YKK6_9BACT|nr:HNH endonuclease [Flectobacillus longus]MDI9864123.1 HNH endonuclease domain-containing protein [Flectobacillus longus]
MKVVKELWNSKGERVTFKDFADEYFHYPNQPANHSIDFGFKKTGNTSDFFTSVKSKLELEKENNGNQNQKFPDCITYLIENFERIIKVLPEDLAIIRQEFEERSKQGFGDYNSFKKWILDIFDYKRFRDSSKIRWFGNCLGVKSCLYCNAQFTHIIKGKFSVEKLLFQFDHFYPKEQYPYLSLSFGNLVVCCSTCNQHKSNTFDSKNLHPYHHDADGIFKFEVSEEDILGKLLGLGNNSLKPEIKILNENSTTIKFNKDRIEKIYENHADVVEELLLKSLYYDESKKSELLNAFEGLNLSESMIDRLILGNYVLEEDINKRPLSKLTKDISKQLKLIK